MGKLASKMIFCQFRNKFWFNFTCFLDSDEVLQRCWVCPPFHSNNALHLDHSMAIKSIMTQKMAEASVSSYIKFLFSRWDRGYPVSMTMFSMYSAQSLVYSLFDVFGSDCTKKKSNILPENLSLVENIHQEILWKYPKNWTNAKFSAIMVIIEVR